MSYPDDRETLWCSRCGRPARVRVVPQQFSQRLPMCCGVQDWCESPEEAAEAMTRDAHPEPNQTSGSVHR